MAGPGDDGRAGAPLILPLTVPLAWPRRRGPDSRPIVTWAAPSSDGRGPLPVALNGTLARRRLGIGILGPARPGFLWRVRVLQGHVNLFEPVLKKYF